MKALIKHFIKYFAHHNYANERLDYFTGAEKTPRIFFLGCGIQKNLEMDVEFFFLQKETKKKEEEIWKKRIFNRPATKVKQFFFGRN